MFDVTLRIANLKKEIIASIISRGLELNLDAWMHALYMLRRINALVIAKTTITPVIMLSRYSHCQRVGVASRPE